MSAVDVHNYIGIYRIFGYFAFYCLFLILVLDFQIDDECSYEYSYIFVANLLEGVGVIAALNTVDRLGRSVSQTLFFVVTAALLFTYGGLYVGSESTAALVMLFIAKITSAGAMCVLWIQTAEIYPTEVRTHILLTTNHNA